ncbi:MAG TPA: MgtC/SapB family protein [Candidatus Limnocylindrales bacterium]|nr:MgtC/SapB family protein [Candidatus Limnocylindrales bacterium]
MNEVLELLTGQGELAVRLLVASVLGAAIGFERELHAHPAGMRTHLLVSLGSAIFTVLSIHGFGGFLAPGEGGTIDPTRIAAQIVSGIGFLGAGAIIHYGTSVKGLTTAASLWATAAIGLAVGAQEYAVGVVGTAIVLFSLGPLNRLAARVEPRGGRRRDLRLRLELTRLEALGAVSDRLKGAGVEMTAVESRTLAPGRYEVEFDLRAEGRVTPERITAAIGGLPEVTLLEVSEAAE